MLPHAHRHVIGLFSLKGRENTFPLIHLLSALSVSAFRDWLRNARAAAGLRIRIIRAIRPFRALELRMWMIYNSFSYQMNVFHGLCHHPAAAPPFSLKEQAANDPPRGVRESIFSPSSILIKEHYYRSDPQAQRFLRT